MDDVSAVGSDVPWPCCRDTGNVRSFPAPWKAPREPVPAVVNMARTLLRYAESGELQALACAVVYADDVSPAGECNSGFVLGRGTYFAVSHAIRNLNDEWSRYCAEITRGHHDRQPPPPTPPAA